MASLHRGSCSVTKFIIMWIYQLFHFVKLYSFGRRYVITMTSHEDHAVSNHRPFDYLLSSLCGSSSQKHQILHYWLFVAEIHRWPVNSSQKGPVMQKKFPYDDVIMVIWICYVSLLYRSTVQYDVNLCYWSYFQKIMLNHILQLSCTR